MESGVDQGKLHKAPRVREGPAMTSPGTSVQSWSVSPLHHLRGSPILSGSCGETHGRGLGPQLCRPAPLAGLSPPCQKPPWPGIKDSAHFTSILNSRLVNHDLITGINPSDPLHLGSLLFLLRKLHLAHWKGGDCRSQEAPRCLEITKKQMPLVRV